MSWLECAIWPVGRGLLISWRCALGGPLPPRDVPVPEAEPVRLALTGTPSRFKAQRLHRKLRTWLQKSSPSAVFVNAVGPSELAFDLGWCLRDWSLLGRPVLQGDVPWQLSGTPGPILEVTTGPVGDTPGYRLHHTDEQPPDEVLHRLPVDRRGIEQVDLACPPRVALFLGHTWSEPVWVGERRERWIHTGGQRPPDAPEELLRQAREWMATGRTLEARNAVERLLERSDAVEHRVEAALMASSIGDAELAVERVRAGLLLHPADGTLLDLLAQLALEGIDEALEAAPSQWRQAAARHVRAGDLARAEAVAREAHGNSSLARFALWKLQLDRAAELADPEDPEGRLVLGACAVLDGTPEEALAWLDPAPADEIEWLGRDAVHTWRSIALYDLGRFEEALGAADLAMSQARVWSLHAQLQRIRCIVALEPAATELEDAALEPLFEKLPGFFPERDSLIVEGEVPEIEAVLPRFGGNRSAYPTHWDGTELRRLVPKPHLRHEARKLQKLLLSRPIPEVLAAFDALAAAHPRAVHPLTFRGEVLLWVGRYPEAEALFRRVIAMEPRTVWGWIGLGAAQMLQDQLTESLGTWAQGVDTCQFEGPSLFAYRGEAWLRLGHRDKARADLEHAVRSKPRRLSAWVNLGLLGDPVMERLERFPQLMNDARALCSSPQPEAILIALRKSLRGNRSSMLTTYFVGDQLRSCHFTP